MKRKSAKSTVILKKSNSNRFLDLNPESDLPKVMEVLNKLMAGDKDEQ